MSLIIMIQRKRNVHKEAMNDKKENRQTLPEARSGSYRVRTVSLATFNKYHLKLLHLFRSRSSTRS